MQTHTDAETVRDVMMPEPWMVDASVTLDDAARLMRAWDVRDVLVTEAGELRGILTDEDMVVFAVASGRRPGDMTAGECCYPGVHRVAADTATADAAAFMHRNGLSRLPVVDGRQLVGAVWTAHLAPLPDPATDPTYA